MDLAEQALGLVRCGRHRGPVGHVDEHAAHVQIGPGELGQGLVEVVLADVANDHLHAGLGEDAGHAEADAAGAAGDEGDLAVDGLHADRSFRA